MVSKCGDGNYLELGTWRGASATVAAMTKKLFGRGGRVVCVDHFCGYNHEYIGPDAALNMFAKYGVMDMVNVVISASRPFPKTAAGDTFECAFIDADHWGENPYLDFVEVEPMVSRFILMDDCDPQHEDVQEAVKRISFEFDKTWKRVYARANCALFERITNGNP
jgi:predicted O-methyltransferase YrrM